MGAAYCLNCMKIITDENENCPSCGLNNSNIRNDAYCLPAGTILQGSYLVGKMLGQGGFGITYMGYDLKNKQKVAIKEYYPQAHVSRNNSQSNSLQFSGSQEARKIFLDNRDHFFKEAKRMAKVDDIPNIVTVIDAFEENETTYIVMEFAEGINLKKYLATKGVMEIKQCLELFEPLFNSLSAVHKRDIIHRDISPDNIMISEEQKLMLIDFGASKEVDSGVSTALVVKKGFSPPEQYAGSGDTGTWSDVYSLCGTIYYCITGQVIPEAMDRVMEDKLSFDKKLLSPVQIQALKKGLAVKPQARTQTVDELWRDLWVGSKLKSKPWYKDPMSIILLLAVGVPLVILVGIILIGVISTVAGTDNWEENRLGANFLIGTGYSEEDITKVFFLDGLENQGSEAWDVSADQSGSVMAWVEETNNGAELYIGAEGGINGRLAAGSMFSEYVNLKEINFNDCLHLDYATDMRLMFSSCGSLTTLDLSSFNTSQVTDMCCMFYNCESLTSLDLSNFDTSQVTDMSKMFLYCGSLTSLDVSSFNTSQVTSMLYMFSDCYKLNTLDVSNFDTSQVTNMMGMFDICKSLTSLDVSNFDTSQVNDMSYMFRDCKSLTSLDVSNFDTSKADTTNMFKDCTCKIIE